MGQLRLRGSTGSGLRLGLVMALFSFCGFESATTMGSEARNPLQDDPARGDADRHSGGSLFHDLRLRRGAGFHAVGQDLGTSPAPMHVLANLSGVPVFGLLIDVGALVSLFAGTLGCITAAARVLLLMAHHGLAHASLRSTHARNETPGLAVMVTGLAALLPVAVLQRAEPVDWTSTAGSGRWPRTDLLWRTRWSAPRLPRYLRRRVSLNRAR